MMWWIIGYFIIGFVYVNILIAKYLRKGGNFSDYRLAVYGAVAVFWPWIMFELAKDWYNKLNSPSDSKNKTNVD